METKKIRELISTEWDRKMTETIKKVEEADRKPSSRIMEMSESKGIPGLTITVEEAQKKYGLSAYRIEKIAKERDALLCIGEREYILDARLEEYVQEKKRKKNKRVVRG